MHRDFYFAKRLNIQPWDPLHGLITTQLRGFIPLLLPSYHGNRFIWLWAGAILRCCRRSVDIIHPAQQRIIFAYFRRIIFLDLPPSMECCRCLHTRRFVMVCFYCWRGCAFIQHLTLLLKSNLYTGKEWIILMGPPAEAIQPWPNQASLHAAHPQQSTKIFI